jgi:hypothetical protein
MVHFIFLKDKTVDVEKVVLIDVFAICHYTKFRVHATVLYNSPFLYYNNWRNRHFVICNFL